MASSSAGRASGVTNRIRNTASSTFSNNQSLLTDIRKGFGLIKDIAVDFERQNQSDKVKELDEAFVELFNGYENCQNFSMAIQAVGDIYQPKQEPTDFKKMIENEMLKVKANSSLSDPQNQVLRRRYLEDIWNVHHAGQPMPGDDQEDIVMTSTQFALRNLNCPLSGKPITELSDPVRSVDCKHIYDKKAIMNYMQSMRVPAKCPVAACPKILETRRVFCDPLLPIEIEELRAMNKQNANTEVIEDFTAFDQEEDD